MLEQLANVLIPAAVGAFTACIPLWNSVRKLKYELSESKAKLDVQLKKETNAVDRDEKINTEAEWKRILDQKDGIIASLRTRDDEQEKQIQGLAESGIKCRENEARTDERMKNSERIRKSMNRQIKLLVSKINELDAIIQKGNNAKLESGSGSHQALFGLAIIEEEEAGDGPSKNLRTDGSNAGS